ncbi:MAG: lamin tail domain-containing protein [Bacteroidota bacterium]
MIKKIVFLALLIPAIPCRSQQLMINEVAAAIVNSQVDDYGEFEDWIEIFNPTATDIDIGGWFITDDIKKPAKWRIPATNPRLTNVIAGHYLLLFADKDTTQGPAHLGFALNKGGEQLALFRLVADGFVLVDSVRYDKLPADCSFGRCLEINNSWLVLKKPTPGKQNICPVSRKTR